MKITYNAPVVLNYTLICVIITALDQFVFGGTEARPGSLAQNFFMVYPFGTAPMEASNPLMYFRLFSHAMGHAGWNHLVGNFSLILLLGPVLEEKYGSQKLLVIIFSTALVTGILNAFLFMNGLLGASGIVFMMIILSSFTNARKGTIPLTFILVALLYVGKEVYGAFFVNNNISEFAHIIGGLCGGVFGYMLNARNPPAPTQKSQKTTVDTFSDLNI